jgi:small membrane protein
MIIKILLISGILGAVIFALRSSGSTTLLAVRRVGVLAFAGAAAVSILFPDALTWVANRVGVGRGADLLLYGSVIIAIFVALGFHHRVQALEERVTLLTRALALHDSKEDRER